MSFWSQLIYVLNNNSSFNCQAFLQQTAALVKWTNYQKLNYMNLKLQLTFKKTINPKNISPSNHLTIIYALEYISVFYLGHGKYVLLLDYWHLFPTPHLKKSY